MMMYRPGMLFTTADVYMGLLIILISWALLWLIAYPLYRWIAGDQRAKLWFGVGAARTAFVMSLAGAVINACWLVGGIHLPGMRWPYDLLTTPSATGPYLAWLSELLPLGLLPVLASGLLGELLVMASAPARPMRVIAAQCLLLVVAGACCLWMLGLASGVTVVSTVGLAFGAALVIALFRAAERPVDAASTDLSPERARVLRLLEEGKINAHESAELLTALAQTVPDAPIAAPLSRGRNVMIAGVLVALVGFFLPWYEVNLQAEVNRVMGWTGSQQTTGPQQIPLGLPFNQPSSGGSISVHGGDVGDGLGWITLALAFVVVVLPYVAPKLPAANLRTIILLALAAGSVITLYLLTSGWRHVTYGICVFAGGYVILWVGAMADRPVRGIPQHVATAAA